MNNTPQQRFEVLLKEYQLDFGKDIQPGANYAVAIQDGHHLYISGQIPRVNGEIKVVGKASNVLQNGYVRLESARLAAKICILKALAITAQQLGDINLVAKVLKLTVYVQSAEDFTQQSEVSDAASEVLYQVFAPNGAHTRTSVGVAQLPKNATVELDLLLSIATS